MELSQWAQTLKQKYSSGIGNVFVLTGNITDYAAPGVLFMDYLVNTLVDMKMDNVNTYDLDVGSESLYEKSKGHKKPRGYKRVTTSMSIALDDWAETLSTLKGQHEKCAHIICYPEFLMSNSDNIDSIPEVERRRMIGLHKVMNSTEFMTSDNILIFVAEVKSNVNGLFLGSTSRAIPIEVKRPSNNERLTYIKYLKETENKPVKWHVDEEQFVKLSAGLSCFNLEDIYLLAEISGKLNREMIVERKRELIEKEYGEVVEMFDTEGYSLDQFIGQDKIKEYVKEVVIDPILSGEVSIVPKGIIAMGPPGTGKTYFAKCLAGDAGINFVEFKMSKILDKWVGTAEKNLEKAFSCFESLAPVGVFIDEIDQVLSRGEDDSNSVRGNMFGAFLSFLSEPSHRGKIVFIGATNYPNKLDEALKRAGRFDKKIPFLPPPKEERVDVFKAYLQKSKYPFRVVDYDSLAEKTDNYTQAEIEGVVIKAVEVALRKKKPEITDEVLIYALDCIVSTQNHKVQEMTDIALSECNDKEFLPQRYKEMLENRPSIRRSERA